MGWRPLEPPRAASAVLGEAAAAAALATATARRIRAGARLQAAFAEDKLLVCGATDELPWAPDVIYLGREHDVLVPTTRDPTVPIDLLSRAVRQEEGFDTQMQLALLPGRAIAFRLSAESPDPDWLDRRAAGSAQ